MELGQDQGPAAPARPCPPGRHWELERQLAAMIAQFNRRVLIDLFIWNDDQNSSRHIIYVRHAGRGAGRARAGGQGVLRGAGVLGAPGRGVRGY